MIVIDASATIALLLNEDAAFGYGERIFTLPDEPLIAPCHWAAEVGNALVMNVRRGRLDTAQFDRIMTQLDRLKVKLEPPPRSTEMAAIAFQAVKTGLTYYDAAYVEKAQSRQASLFTFDQKMRDAASRFDIPLLPA